MECCSWLYISLNYGKKHENTDWINLYRNEFAQFNVVFFLLRIVIVYIATVCFEGQIASHEFMFFNLDFVKKVLESSKKQIDLLCLYYKNFLSC